MTANEEQQLGALMADVANLKDRFEKIETGVTEIRDAVLAAKGSWKAVMGIAGLAAALGGLMAKFLPFWFTKP